MGEPLGVLLLENKERGITSILLQQTSGIEASEEISGNGYSSILDAVLFLRYSINGGEVNRILNLMKMRGSSHSNQYREYLITDHGIDILDLFTGEGGVLTGTARLQEEARIKIEANNKALLLEQKKAEIMRLEKAVEAEAVVSQAAIAVQQNELAILEQQAKTTVLDKAARIALRNKGETLE